MKLKILITTAVAFFLFSATNLKARAESQKRDTAYSIIETDFAKITKQATDYFKLAEVEAIARRDSTFNHDSTAKVVFEYAFPLMTVDYQRTKIERNFLNEMTGKLNQKIIIRQFYARHGEISWIATCVFYGTLVLIVLLEIALFHWAKKRRERKGQTSVWYAFFTTLVRWFVMGFFIFFIGNMIVALSGTLIEFPILWIFMLAIMITTIICALYTKIKKK